MTNDAVEYFSLLAELVLQKVETDLRVAIHHGPDSDPLKIFGQISRQSQRRLHGSGEERHAEMDRAKLAMNKAFRGCLLIGDPDALEIFESEDLYTF